MTDTPISAEERTRHVVEMSGRYPNHKYLYDFVIEAIRQAETAAREPHQQRWQRLVNTVASAWNDGTVPGNDDEAVEWAIQMIADRGHD